MQAFKLTPSVSFSNVSSVESLSEYLYNCFSNNQNLNPKFHHLSVKMSGAPAHKFKVADIVSTANNS